MATEYYLIKALLVGPERAGKTSIVNQLTKTKPFTAEYKGTIGIDFDTAFRKKDGKTYKFQLWDSAGQERFRTITSAYYRGADVVFVAWDETAEKSPEALRQMLKGYLQDIEDNTHGPTPRIIFVRNKIDKETTTGVTAEQRQSIIAELSLPKDRYSFVEVSAKTGDGFDKLDTDMVSFAAEAHKNRSALSSSFEPSAVSVTDTRRQRRSCGCGFFRSPSAQIATGIIGATAGTALAITAKPLVAWLAWRLLATTAPQAAAIALLTFGLVLLAASALLALRGGLQYSAMRRTAYMSL